MLSNVSIFAIKSVFHLEKKLLFNMQQCVELYNT